MIKYYDCNRMGTHTIRITFMYKDYVGHISFEVDGNCHGWSVLDTNLPDESILIENDCCYEKDGEYDTFYVELKDECGSTLSIEGDEDEMRDHIVSIEIVAFEDPDDETEVDE